MSSHDHHPASPEESPVDLLLAMSSTSTGGLADVMERGLAHATTFFGLDFGIVSRVEDGRYVIEHLHQPDGAGLEVGQEFPLGDTYCAITLEASDLISIDEMRSSSHSGHPCYEAFQLESYIGVPLHVDGEVYGTLNFSAPNVRQRPWSETDRQLVLMLARWVEGTISQARLRQLLSSTLRELDHANRELVTRNADLESFARQASHDLQAPLQNVTALVRILAEDLEDGDMERAAEDSRMISGEVARMSDLVQALLTLARTGRAEIGDDLIQLNDCVDAALDSLQQTIEAAGAEIVVGDLPAVQGSAQLLTQVFQNLISNAVKFRRADATPRVEVLGRALDGAVEVTVSDNGIGIDPDKIEQIFKPLTRLHSASDYAGSGIGLAIVRKVVGRHGGEVSVQSTPGDGSTFKITLGTRS
ncbi:MAG: ATP-binding protein [Planctomycetota bacterium]|nr:ATP-binding protein [Planctomycetota bacterium]